MKSKKWEVSVGFATGAPQYQNASWFFIKDSVVSKTKEEAIEIIRKIGYGMSNDICADWVFSCEEI